MQHQSTSICSGLLGPSVVDWPAVFPCSLLFLSAGVFSLPLSVDFFSSLGGSTLGLDLLMIGLHTFSKICGTMGGK